MKVNVKFSKEDKVDPIYISDMVNGRFYRSLDNKDYLYMRIDDKVYCLGEYGLNFVTFINHKAKDYSTPNMVPYYGDITITQTP